MEEQASMGVGSDEQQRAEIVDVPSPDEVDEERFEALERKRGEEGLTDEEAGELGRMMAAKEGKPYSNAAHREDPDAMPEPESMKEEGQVVGDPRRREREPGPQTADDEAKDIAR